MIKRYGGKNLFIREGFTLVEALAAIAIFAAMSTAIFSVYAACDSLIKKQREFAAFESVCLDIGFYGDVFGRDWAKEYFGSEYADKDEGTSYYDSSYAVIPSADGAEYILSYYYEGDSLIVDVRTASGREIISSLDYGPARYSESGGEAQ